MYLVKIFIKRPVSCCFTCSQCAQESVFHTGVCGGQNVVQDAKYPCIHTAHQLWVLFCYCVQAVSYTGGKNTHTNKI